MTAPVIDYAPPRRRRWRRWLLVAVLVLAAGALAWYRDPLWRSANLAYHGYHARRAFEDCATLALPTDRPLYADQGDVPSVEPLGPHGYPINLREVRPDLLPAPSVPPIVAPVPEPLKRLERHVRAGAAHDGTRLRFHAPAVATTAKGADEAIVYVGEFDINSSVAPASRYVWGVFVGPHELRWARLAFTIPPSAGGPTGFGLTSLPGPWYGTPSIVIVRAQPCDRLEWFAGRHESAERFVLPYRLNGVDGTLTTIRHAPEGGLRFEATHGWVVDHTQSNQVWYLGQPDVTLATIDPDWQDVPLKNDAAVRGVAIDDDGDATLVAQRRDWSEELEVWRVEAPMGIASSIAHVSLPPGEAFLGTRDGAVQLSRDGSRFACAGAGSAFVFDARGGSLLATVPLPRATDPGTRDVGARVALSDRGRVCVVVSGDARRITWHGVDRDRSIGSLLLDDGPSEPHAVVTAVGTFLFRRSADWPLCFVQPGEVVGVVQPGEAERHAVAAEPDPSGRRLALVNPQRGSASRLSVYDVEREAVALASHEGMEPLNRSAVWSGDGNRVLFVGRRHLFVVDVSGRTVVRFPKPLGFRAEVQPYRAALSHDGRVLAIAWTPGRIWFASIELPGGRARTPARDVQNTSAPKTPM